MAGRVLAQIIIAGSQIVARSFMQAYQKAAAEAARNGGRAATQQNVRREAANGAKADASTSSSFTRSTGMSLGEAHQILDVKVSSPPEEILKKYEHLFKINEKSAGGSFYLQSKVFRAKERIEMENPDLVNEVHRRNQMVMNAKEAAKKETSNDDVSTKKER